MRAPYPFISRHCRRRKVNGIASRLIPVECIASLRYRGEIRARESRDPDEQLPPPCCRCQRGAAPAQSPGRVRQRGCSRNLETRKINSRGRQRVVCPAPTTALQTSEPTTVRVPRDVTPRRDEAGA